MPRLPTHGKWVRNKAPDRGKVRSVPVLVRFSEAERAALEKAADVDEIDMARIIRAGTMAEVGRRLRRAGVPTEPTSSRDSVSTP